MRGATQQHIAAEARAWRIEVTDRGQVIASITPTDAQAEELRALRTSVARLQATVNLLTARLGIYALSGRGR